MRLAPFGFYQPPARSGSISYGDRLHLGTHNLFPSPFALGISDRCMLKLGALPTPPAPHDPGTRVRKVIIAHHNGRCDLGLRVCWL